MNLRQATAAGVSTAALSLQTLDVFLNEPEAPMVWLVDRLLPAGGLSELVAKPKVGKSTLARCLAAAVAQGRPFLGCATHPGPVIYCGFEERRHEVRQHFRQLGLREADPIHVLIGATPRDFLLRLSGSIADLRPALVIIDPLIRVTRVRDLSEYAEVAQALEPVGNLARETNTHLQLVHHGRKAPGEGGDSSLGSSAIFAAVDIGLFIRKTPGGQGGRLISSEQRYGDGLDAERVLLLDPVTGWVTLGHTRRESAELEMEDILFAWLGEQTEAVEEKVILADMEGRRGAKVVALRRLVAAGRVLRTGAGGRRDPFHYRRAPTG
jgi:AAA domain